MALLIVWLLLCFAIGMVSATLPVPLWLQLVLAAACTIPVTYMFVPLILASFKGEL